MHAGVATANIKLIQPSACLHTVYSMPIVAGFPVECHDIRWLHTGNKFYAIELAHDNDIYYSYMPILIVETYPQPW